MAYPHTKGEILIVSSMPSTVQELQIYCDLSDTETPFKMKGFDGTMYAFPTEVAAKSAHEEAAAQVSGAEITAGTETELRSYSPADVKSFVETHGGGGGSAVERIALTLTSETASLLYGSGSYTAGTGSSGAKLSTGTTVGSLATRRTAYWTELIEDHDIMDFNPTFSWGISFDGDRDDVDDFVGVSNAASNPLSAVGLAPSRHYIGFLCERRSGTLTLYAVNAAGSSETRTSLGEVDDDRTNFVSVHYDGTSLKFYLNGALGATHTTNILTSGIASDWVSVTNRASTDDADLRAPIRSIMVDITS